MIWYFYYDVTREQVELDFDTTMYFLVFDIDRQLNFRI